MNVDQTLQRLQAAEVQCLPLASLVTDEALQPREAHMVPFREQTRVEARSAEHVGTMRLALEAAQHVELEPLLVADVAGRLLVVDGHHRLKAYRLAGRESVPCRVGSMDHRGAVLVSKLVNCSARSLEMHPRQRTDAAWQYLAAVTRQGADGLPVGESLRKIAARFGISRATPQRMWRKLPKVDPKAYPAEKRDPGTGFPRWQAVCDWRKQTDDDETGEAPMNEQQWTRREAASICRKLGKLETGTTADAWKLALRMYAEEAKAEASNPDTLAFLAEIAEPEAALY